MNAVPSMAVETSEKFKMKLQGRKYARHQQIQATSRVVLICGKEVLAIPILAVVLTMPVDVYSRKDLVLSDVSNGLSIIM